MRTDVEPIVHLRSGRLRGSTVENAMVFRGVPFAAPPFGARRFQPPRPVEPWTGVRDATAFGPIPPQVHIPGTEAFAPDRGVPGEDCLNLNVWTPDPGAAGLPVMVWIGGGFFEVGSGASYDGRNFARDGVVCVTINYRVGADGFLYVEDGTADVGLLDQVAALEWMRENISAFGGDPGNVTVFGESAGAMSIGTLLAMPRVEGLFRRAVLQSGAAHHVSPPEVARQVGEDLAARLGVPPTREAITGVPLERLLRVQAEQKADLMAHPDPIRWGTGLALSGLLWQPVIDGDVVPTHPLERIAGGAAAQIDLLAGTNLDEGRLALVATEAISQITPEALVERAALNGLPVDQALAAYRQLHPGGAAGDLVAALDTDSGGESPQSGWPTPTRAVPPDLHVRVRLAVAGLRRPAGRLSRARDPVRVRHP